MHIIQVTNVAGSILYVDSTSKKYKSGFTVRTRKFAKKFETRELAEKAIQNFKPAVAETTFEVVNADVKQHIRVITWNSLTEWEIEVPQNGWSMTLPITATDEELIAYLRDHDGDQIGEDGEWEGSWDSIARGENTATIEWRNNDGNHLAVTTVIWTE